ncbi:MAG: DUF1566 domain-containing protein [Deltaproteobacteria bacterium]|nr:DUF1566 domain-containing protein [Deltaproteobacteria bacterium]
MKRSILLLFLTSLAFLWGQIPNRPILAKDKITHLQVIAITGQFFSPNGKAICEYDYIEPDRKYRLLPNTEILLSTLDGKKSYVAVGPGILFLDPLGSVLLNGQVLKPRAQETLFQNITASRIPSQELAGLPLRGIKVLARTVDGETRVLPLYSGYHATVVGVGNYDKWPKLPNAVNDARQVSKKLKNLGFHVELVLNPNAFELNKALSDLTYRYGRDTNQAILFYYAGHGETEVLADGTNLGYIVPRDCPLLRDDPQGFVNTAISMKDIESFSLRIRSKHVLMLFDSCFSGALFALVRAVPDHITEKSALPVRQYITAGREDEEVPDRSMFKRCFLIGLEGDADMTGDGYITGSEMGMYLADNVVNYTHRRQHPQYGKINNPDLDRGDFIFVPEKTVRKHKEQKRLMAKREDLVSDIQKLRVEREAAQKLVEEMKAILRVSLQTEDQEKDSLKERQHLKKQIARLEKERQTIEDLADARIQEYEATLSKSKARMKEEAVKRKRLEEDLERVRLEKEEAAKQKTKLEALQQKMKQETEKRKALETELDRIKQERKQRERQAALDKQTETIPNQEFIKKEQPHKETPKKQLIETKHQPFKTAAKTTSPEEINVKPVSPRKEQLANIPKQVKAGKLLNLNLRRKPLMMMDSDIEEMVLKRNFYVRNRHETGGFRNDFVDNKDGTITDRSTGLMWEKGGSSYQRRYWGAESHINNLNRNKFLGHNDWRVPTLEELCSLLTKKVEKTGLYMEPVFCEEQNTCWSADTSSDQERENAYYVDFSDGGIQIGYGSNEGSRYEIVESTCFVRAVRTIE